jgi:Family of unknown function (DUF6131)
MSMLVPAVRWTPAEPPPDSSRPSHSLLPEGFLVIILGVILLIVGFLVKIAIVWTIGIVVLAVGLLFALLGAAGRGIGGRRHYW